MTRNKLTLSKVTRIALVDRGDNPEAHALIHKRAQEAAPPSPPPPAPTSPVHPSDSVFKRFLGSLAGLLGKPQAEVEKAYEEATTFGELNQARQMRAAVSETWDYAWQWQEAVASILRDPDLTAEDRGTMIRTSNTEFVAAVEAAIAEWVNGETTSGVEKILKAGRAISTARLTRLQAAHAELGAIISELTPSTTTTDDKTMADDVTKTTPPAPAAGNPSVDDVLKGAPPALQLLFKQQQEAVEAAQRTATEALGKAAAADDARETAEITKRFDKGGDLHGLPNSAELIPTLKALKSGSPDQFTVVEKSLLASAEAIRKGALFTEIGAGGTDGADGADPYSQLVAKAEEIRKSTPALTQAQAIDRAMIDPANAEIVKAYRTQNGAR